MILVAAVKVVRKDGVELWREERGCKNEGSLGGSVSIHSPMAGLGSKSICWRTNYYWSIQQDAHQWCNFQLLHHNHHSSLRPKIYDSMVLLKKKQNKLYSHPFLLIICTSGLQLPLPSQVGHLIFFNKDILWMENLAQPILTKKKQQKSIEILLEVWWEENRGASAGEQDPKQSI
jgi:hypothetical protein